MEFPVLVEAAIVNVEQERAQAYADALSVALSDPEWVSKTRASGPYTENITRTVAPLDYAEHNKSLSMGRWNFVMEEGNPAWELRFPPQPGASRITLVAPLIFTNEGWIVQDLFMQRAR